MNASKQIMTVSYLTALLFIGAQSPAFADSKLSIICANTSVCRLNERLSELVTRRIETSTGREQAKLKRRYRSWPKRRLKACPNYSERCLHFAYQAEMLTYGKVDTAIDDPYGGGDSIFREQHQPCTFVKADLPKKIDVYAGGAYRGRETPHTIDDSNKPATRFSVIVNSPRKPVALILGAYEPSVWEVSWTEGTQIRAVYATGYHRQAVVGLHNTVPVITSTFKDKGACGWTYVDKRKLADLNPLSEKVFGKKVKEVMIAERGAISLGLRMPTNAPLVTSPDTPLNSVIDPRLPRNGAEGIADLLEKGAIRPMREDDYLRWARRSYKANKNKYPNVVGQSPLEPHKPGSNPHQKSYLIEEKILIPPGLAGGNSVVLFLDSGVPYPKGFLAHSTLFNFNDMTCRGQICGRR